MAIANPGLLASHGFPLVYLLEYWWLVFKSGGYPSADGIRKQGVVQETRWPPVLPADIGRRCRRPGHGRVRVRQASPAL